MFRVRRDRLQDRLLCSAVKYLHEHGIMHRDLKLANIFLAKGMQLRLGDFGFATFLDGPDDSRRSICGTPNYISPEVMPDLVHT